MRGDEYAVAVAAEPAGVGLDPVNSERQIASAVVPVARARMASPTAEAGIVCVRKSIADKLFDDPQQGILKFPNGKFADLADVLSHCIQRHGSTGFKYHSESQDEDWEEEDLLGQLGY